VIEHWSLPLLASNPAMLEMFRNRDRPDSTGKLLEKEGVAWGGEFVGKFLLGCIGQHRLTRRADQG
jgi:hypothetical protein